MARTLQKNLDWATDETKYYEGLHCEGPRGPWAAIRGACATPGAKLTRLWRHGAKQLAAANKA